MGSIIYLCVFLVNFGLIKADLFPRRHSTPIPTDQALARDIQIYVDTIQMPIDHFDPNNNRTFAMRYAYRNDIWNGTGPLFLYIGGEQSLEDQVGALYAGQFYDMAKETGAYMIASEHRYYGQSVPNMNLKTSNMRWMTFSQALADLTYLINDRKQRVNGLQGRKVVVVGGSYPANLAAWMRLKYPNIVDAALSSSAVIKIQVDNYQYNEGVQKDLMYNQACLKTITNGINMTMAVLRTRNGAAKVQEDYNTCEVIDVQSRPDVANFYNNIAVRIGNIAQYNHQGVYMTIDQMCGELTKNSNTTNDYQRLAKFVNTWNRLYNSDGCMPNYTSTIAYYRETTPDNTRPWIYEICSSLGLLITTDSPNQPYLNTFPLQFWYYVCQDTFGITLNPASVNLGVSRTQMEFGGANPQITKTVFVVGSVDPWSGVGLSQSLNPEAPLFIVEGGSHCQDLGSSQQSDSQSLKDARAKTKQYIYSWI